MRLLKITYPVIVPAISNSSDILRPSKERIYTMTSLLFPGKNHYKDKI